MSSYGVEFIADVRLSLAVFEWEPRRLCTHEQLLTADCAA